ncbi:hypothetical protein P7K49_016981 [Saguinus oedipus]|uniref:Uncharacterized protein n=1 Tax=Saguinus oedipus TaxID=9490 RepID=A0ABQ9V292_SAGOE|nr:hypothetical protein P7K49_016981 [Saguinus oedipus]
MRWAERLRCSRDAVGRVLPGQRRCSCEGRRREHGDRVRTLLLALRGSYSGFARPFACLSGTLVSPLPASPFPPPLILPSSTLPTTPPRRLHTGSKGEREIKGRPVGPVRCRETDS